MRKLYRFLYKMTDSDDISCILFVCRYGSTINENYKNLVNFYYEIFRNVVNTNVMIVITDVQINDTKWVRARKGIDNVTSVLNKTKTEISQLLHLPSDAVTLHMDCLAETGKDFDEAKKIKRTNSVPKLLAPLCK